MAHNDVISILLPIFSEFAHTKEYVHAEIIRKHGRFPATATWDSIQTVYTASTEFVCDATMHLLTLANSFNGDNWPSLDTALGLTLETVSDSALTINNLLAMQLLHGIQVAGKNNHVWAARLRSSPNDSAAARAKCLQAFLATRVSSGSQYLSPYLEDQPELRERDFVDPYP